jgi:hypothetical protein
MEDKASQASSIERNTPSFRNEASRRTSRSQQKSKLLEVAFAQIIGKQ